MHARDKRAQAKNKNRGNALLGTDGLESWEGIPEDQMETDAYTDGGWRDALEDVVDGSAMYCSLW